MSHRLEVEECLPGAIRRIAWEQVEKDEASLNLMEEDPEEVIHDARAARGGPEPVAPR